MVCKLHRINYNLKKIPKFVKIKNHPGLTEAPYLKILCKGKNFNLHSVLECGIFLLNMNGTNKVTTLPETILQTCKTMFSSLNNHSSQLLYVNGRLELDKG